MALKNLKTNRDIHITKADKSNIIVILNKVDYKAKMDLILEDQTTYSEVLSNPTDQVNKNFNKKMKCLLKDNPDLIKKFSSINPSFPYMYGVIKTHKEGYPVRPIISSVGSASYKLSKWLTSVMTPLVGMISQSHLKNTGDLIEKMKQHDCDNCTLISFDVNSLFTKVPVPDLLQFLRDFLQDVDLPVNLNIF